MGILLSICFAAASVAIADEAASTTMPPVLFTFLREHCFDCHNSIEAEGALNLEDFSFNPSDRSNLLRWVTVFDRVRTAEMPPQDATRPDSDQLEDFLAAVAGPINKSLRKETQEMGRVRSRRLNRIEYENTLHDLLGIDIPLKDLLPEDTYHDGFATVASAQQVSHHLLEKYLDVADLALENAFARVLDPIKPYRRHYSSSDLGRDSGQRDPWHVGDETIAWSSNQAYHGRVPETEVTRDGWYRITLHDAHSVNTDPGDGIWCTLRTGVCFAKAPLMYSVGTFLADERRRDQTFEAWIRKGHIIEARPSDNTIPRVQGNQLNSYKGSTRDSRPMPKVPGLAYSSITIEAIDHSERRNDFAKLLLGDQPVDENAVREVIAHLMTDFATRAFRRPVTREVLNPYLSLVDEDLANGLSFHDTLKRGYRAILCSPRFLFLQEMPGPLDDYSIAARLSYFLWSTMPDESLLTAAALGELTNEYKRYQQVERMLNDSRAGEGLVTALADQWLNLREIDFTAPDSKLYPEFDEPLQISMVAETHAFLRKLIDENLPAANIIDSDFAMLNDRLAKHYGIPDVHHEELRAVSLKPDDHRGGLITQGSILKITANGTTTSPVVRGAFFNERILGVMIPPPPDNVPAIEPDIRGATSIRDQLNKHSNDRSCAACHIKIDPPGFALENYDVIGGWRTAYRNSGSDFKSKSQASSSGIPVDPHHQMPTGEAFEGIEQFKRIVLRDPERIARNFTHQLITYSTGSPISFGDRAEVESILQKTKLQHYGIRDLIHAVVNSPLFLCK
jgi:hypothetical protein